MDRHDAFANPAFIIALDHAAGLLQEAERERLRRAAVGAAPRRGWSLLPLFDLRLPRRPTPRPVG